MSLSSDLVAANLQRLMAASADCRSQAALARRSKVPQRTIGRILNKEVTPSLDVLEQLAKAFDLLPWQLLVPELDPRNAPVLRFATAAEEALYKRIVESAVELARQKQP
jgi:transcriptional regulator with XRE-family HTH domain